LKACSERRYKNPKKSIVTICARELANNIWNWQQTRSSSKVQKQLWVDKILSLQVSKMRILQGNSQLAHTH
jgi:hypothetical protein